MVGRVACVIQREGANVICSLHLRGSGRHAGVSPSAIDYGRGEEDGRVGRGGVRPISAAPEISIVVEREMNLVALQAAADVRRGAADAREQSCCAAIRGRSDGDEGRVRVAVIKVGRGMVGGSNRDVPTTLGEAVASQTRG